jgi:FemAB-related protein (PEP-CTERM system-associated)
MIITELTERVRPAWDSYVQRSPHGLPQHLSRWQQVLQKTYGYETCYLLALDKNEGSVIGLLPLFLVQNIFMGRTATTLPGGLCADNADVAQSLIAHGQEFARRVKASRFALHDTRQAWPGDWRTTSYHENWIVDVRMGAEALWQRLDRNIRRQVRMAQNNHLRVEIDRTDKNLDDFYHVLSHFTHQSGTPVFSRRFLENVIESFPQEFNIVMVYKDEQSPGTGARPIGGYFQLQTGDTVYGVWGATLHQYLELRPVYLAYWEILADAANRGFHYLDMGRSPTNSNASKYKSQWGGVCIPIYQQVISLRKGQEATSIAARAHSSAPFRSFMQLWPRLPFQVAQYLGPRLRRYVPFA